MINREIDVSPQGLLQMLDGALLLILAALKLQLTLMRGIIHLWLSTVHHFGVSERSGLSRLIGFGQGLSGVRNESRSARSCQRLQTRGIGERQKLASILHAHHAEQPSSQGRGQRIA